MLSKLMVGWVLCTILAFAQTSTIQGVLVDPSGAAIKGAKITATDQLKNVIAREVITGNDGSFQVANILPGLYDLKIQMSGFKTRTSTSL